MSVLDSMQPEKAPLQILVSFEGTENLVIEENAKAFDSITWRFESHVKSTVLSFLHFWNAKGPIVFTFLGIFANWTSRG